MRWSAARPLVLPLLLILAVCARAKNSATTSADDGALRPAEGVSSPVAASLSPDSALAAQDGVLIGRADAPVVLYEFADFQCPACRAAALQFLPAFEDAYVRTGQVKLVHLDLPLPQHRNARAAAVAGRCADAAGIYASYARRLYERQLDWRVLPDPTNVFADYAAELGAVRADFERCQRSGRFDAAIAANEQLAYSLGVPGTPTFFVGGQMVRGSGRAIVAAVEAALQAR